MRASTRFECLLLVKILRKSITRQLIVLVLSCIGFSVILIAFNWAFELIEKYQNCYCVLHLFWHDNIFAKPCTKMMVPCFSRQNNGGWHAFNVVLWENLTLVVILILESEALYFDFCLKQNYRERYEASCVKMYRGLLLKRPSHLLGRKSNSWNSDPLDNEKLLF